MASFVLQDIPWGFKHPGLRYDSSKKVWIYKGSVLPQALRPFQNLDYSYERWMEDENSSTVQPTKRGSTIFTPREHQKDGAKEVFKHYQKGSAGMIVSDGTGLGKGLSASTKIPTPSGFTTMEDIEEGNMVYGADGNPTKVLKKYVSQAKKFYRITLSDGTTVDADEDHRWLTSSRKERMRIFNGTEEKRRISEEAEESLRNHLIHSQEMREAVTFSSCFESAHKENSGMIRKILSEAGSVGKMDFGSEYIYHPQSVLESLERISLLSGNKWSESGIMPTSSVKNTAELFNTQHLTDSNDKSTHKNHSIRNALPILGEEKNLIVDPYILGAWIGDGGAHHCEITSMDKEIVEKISATYPVQRVFNEEKSGKAKSYSFEGLNVAIHRLYEAPYKIKIKKRIPQEYLTASFSQRLELLKGLLDTDGSISHGKSQGVSFSQKDKELFFQVYSLVCSMGWKSTWRSRDVSFHKDGETNTHYELLFYPDKQVFSVSRKADMLEGSLLSFGENKRFHNRYITHIEKIEKTEEYYCISVDSPDHLYLCTESYLPTHNTLTTLAGITAIARYNKKSGNLPKSGAERATLLIVCPKSVIPGWRQTIQSFPAATEHLRPLIINYQQLNKLLQPPASARAAKRQKTKNRSTARHGKPIVDWDYVILDESHYLKNYPSSATSIAASNLAQLNKPYKKGKSPFTVFSTATPGSSPLNFAVMSQVISPYLAANAKRKMEKPVTPNGWGSFLDSLGFDVREGKVPGEWSWSPTPWFGKNSEDPKEQAKYKALVSKAKSNQRKDAAMIGKALKHPEAPFLMRRPQDLSGWPEQQTIPLPVELTVKQQPIYEEAWNAFRRFLNLTPKGQDPKGSLVEQLRYRQKSSLLKVESAIDHIVDTVNSGKQVFVSCEFSETIEKYKEELKKRKINSVEISGRNVDEREDNRIRFQKGEVPVVLCSVVAGISLHAGETLPDGTKASSAERVTVCHDIRQNPLDVIQLLGRCHRDGQNSLSYFPYFTDTVDEKVVTSFTNKNTNMKLMSGADEGSSEEMENLFRQSAAK